MRPIEFALSLGMAFLVSTCAHPSARPTLIPPGGASQPSTYVSPTYRDPAHWLCLPDRVGDACHADLTATEIRADGTRVVEEARTAPASASDVDCFYVYPTVDMGLFPGNHTDFHDTEPMARATTAQAARFRDVCRLYVPLYRQVTIGTYFRSAGTREEFLSVAYSDVADAFLHYLRAFNHGHRIVLLGHSQGAEMVIRLLRNYFDTDAAMRERLVVAMAIGGDVNVPSGQRVGGTFAHLPLCADDSETGCVIAYRSYRQGDSIQPGQWAAPNGRFTACVNPAHFGSEDPAPLTRTYLPLTAANREHLGGVAGITTPFVLVRSAYTGRCAENPAGYRYLSIAPPDGHDDARASLLNFSDSRMGTALGLHILDFQFPQGDLIDTVAHRTATH